MEEERMKSEEASLGRAVSDLACEVGTLVRQEVELARCELAEKAELAKAGATKVGAGGALAHVGALTLAGAAVLGLTLLLENAMGTLPAMAVSAVVVGAALAAGGTFLLRRGGRDLSSDQLMPRRTVESLKEDARWARKQF